LKFRDPALGQMIRLGRDTGPQKRDLVLPKDHQLSADILDRMANIVDDDALEGRAFSLVEVSAGAFDDYFARQLLKILNLRKGFYPHGLVHGVQVFVFFLLMATWTVPIPINFNFVEIGAAQTTV
jgi:hypothetical protein